MLANRLRCWLNIKPTLVHRPVPAGFSIRFQMLYSETLFRHSDYIFTRNEKCLLFESVRHLLSFKNYIEDTPICIIELIYIYFGYFARIISQTCDKPRDLLHTINVFSLFYIYSTLIIPTVLIYPIGFYAFQSVVFAIFISNSSYFISGFCAENIYLSCIVTCVFLLLF